MTCEECGADLSDRTVTLVMAAKHGAPGRLCVGCWVDGSRPQRLSRSPDDTEPFTANG